jgi:LacI family transcriptional regulator
MPGKNDSMPTMKDVARLAGVSISTVSHVLKGTRHVSEDATDRVRNAVKSLDYKSRKAMRDLNVGGMDAVGVLIPSIVNPFFPEVVQGISEYMQTNDFSVILCSTDERPETERQFLLKLASHAISGLIVAPTAGFVGDCGVLRESGVPLVIIDRRVDLVDVDQVYSDNETGAYTAVKHLVALGHRNVGAISGSIDIQSYVDRTRGWQNALANAGLEARSDDLQQAGPEAETVDQALDRLLGKPTPVSALFSMSNPITLGVLAYLRRHGIRCPEDIALVGFDDSPWAECAYAAVTSVVQQPRQIGNIAAERLLSRIRGETLPPTQISLSCKLVVRDSCGSALRRKGNRLSTPDRI